MHRRCNGWYNSTNTPPWDSNWVWTKVGTTKHAESMLAMDRRWEGKHSKNIIEHVIGWAPEEFDGALLDEITDVVILNVNVL